MTPVPTPDALIRSRPLAPTARATIAKGRDAIRDILHGRDDRLLVVVGPCSIHDPAAALDYARRLATLRARLGDRLEIVMRVYFEKPRTTVGWKGLINDPDLDGSCRIDKGLPIARHLLADLAEMGMPAATEFLDLITPHYLADLVTWGAIGARTTESQVHREMVSHLPCPVGFKNGTDGNVQIAVDAIGAARQGHRFLGAVNGHVGVVSSAGNPDCHVILRGGHAPNSDAASVHAACEKIGRAGLPPAVMIDASHGNSNKNPDNQPRVLAEIGAQVAMGDARIIGVMVESNLVAGQQKVRPGQPLVRGQSITDGCIDWATTERALVLLAEDVVARRGVVARSVA